MSKNSIFLGILLLVSGCSSNNSSQGQMLVLPYSSFGPSSMSGSFLGEDWFQWDDFADSRPRKYDINIVVYRNISLAEVQNKYPISKEKEIDFRCVTYSDSMTYFEKSISIVLDMHKEGYPEGPYIGKLRATKKQIIEKLGE